MGFEEPTDSAAIMNKAVMKSMKFIFKEGVEFKKCGVILTGIENKGIYIPDLLSDPEFIQNFENLQKAMELVKERFGDKKLAIGPCNMKGRSWSMSRNSLTQNYFSLNGMLVINK